MVWLHNNWKGHEGNHDRVTAYSVSQYKNVKVGEATLFNQQIALYKLKNIRDPDPKKIFIDDLAALVKKARRENKDIILTGDFNELVGDDPKGMSTVLSEGDLTDAHEHQHGTVDITGGFPLEPVSFECVAEVRDIPKFFKILRIEVENYPIIMTMGIY
jgi:hypothetical protein